MVVPHYAGRHALDEEPEFTAWLQEKQVEGHSIWAHGLTHQAAWHEEASSTWAPSTWPARWVNRYLTQGESEFMGLSRSRKKARLQKALELFRAAGIRVQGFTPPTWFGGVDADVLRACGLRYQDLRTGILDAETDTLVHAPALVWPSHGERPGSSGRPWGGSWYQGWLMRATTLRFALHPQDVRHADFWSSLEKFVEGRQLCGVESLFDSESMPPLHHWPTHPL